MRLLWSTSLLAAALVAAGANVEAQEPNFGRAVALSGGDLLIGQPVNWYGPGVVYAYRLDAQGRWRERGRLTASDSARMDDFGGALALDGNTLIVGAPRKRDGAGVAYAFERASAEGDWRQTGVIEPPAGGDHAEYASALALAGDDLLVGAPAAEATGVVYHYRRLAGAWSLHEVIRPGGEMARPGGEGIQPGGEDGLLEFGRTLALDGPWLMVGAPAADSGAGRVFAARRLPGGGWGAPSPVNAPSAMAGPGARLGSALLLDGARAWAGAPGDAAVLAFALDSAGTWSPAGSLRPFDTLRGTRFGYALALAGESAAGGELWIGAPGVNGSNGRVYRFLPDGDGGWRSAVRLEPDSADGTEWPFAFGHAMAAAGDRAVVGMPTRDFGEGRALAVAREAGGWEPGQILEGQIFALGGALAPGERCEEGRIEAFTCENIEVVSHMPVSALGGSRGVWVNDVWGWSDPETGRDYALVARRDGAAFVDVTEPSAPRLVGTLPRTKGSPPSVWRDIKVLNDHAYVVADGAGAHGMQVFDLTRLRDVAVAPAAFEPDTTYHRMNSAHNVVADTASGFLYVVGASSGGETCGGGLHMVDARDPGNPVFAGCYNDRSSPGSRGYTHDAQCVTYRGPDEDYRGRQICVGSNAVELNIADVTDKANPVPVARNAYPDVAYAHQGWFDDEQRYFYQNDEGDEVAGTVPGTRTIVWDLSDLDDPFVAREYIGPVPASDHNLFVKGDRMYQSNYGSGLRVLDIRDRTNPREIAFFDSAPLNDDEPGFSAAVSGAWSNYPFFDSGIVVFTSVREGLFIVRVVDPVPIS